MVAEPAGDAEIADIGILVVDRRIGAEIVVVLGEQPGAGELKIGGEPASARQAGRIGVQGERVARDGEVCSAHGVGLEPDGMALSPLPAFASSPEPARSSAAPIVALPAGPGTGRPLPAYQCPFRSCLVSLTPPRSPRTRRTRDACRSTSSLTKTALS